MEADLRLAAASDSGLGFVLMSIGISGVGLAFQRAFQGAISAEVDKSTLRNLSNQSVGATRRTAAAVSVVAFVGVCVSLPTHNGMFKLPSFARILSTGTTCVKPGSSWKSRLALATY